MSILCHICDTEKETEDFVVGQAIDGQPRIKSSACSLCRAELGLKVKCEQAIQSVVGQGRNSKFGNSSSQPSLLSGSAAKQEYLRNHKFGPPARSSSSI